MPTPTGPKTAIQYLVPAVMLVAEMLAEFHSTGRFRKRPGIHQARTAFRKLPLAPAGERANEQLACDQRQHRIAQELEPLVTLTRTAPRMRARVGQRFREKPRVREAVTQDREEGIEVGTPGRHPTGSR